MVNLLLLFFQHLQIMKVNADNTFLNAEIKNGGNIFYKGTPSSILLKKTGKGELIKE